jgi:hypothetical protein
MFLIWVGFTREVRQSAPWEGCARTHAPSAPCVAAQRRQRPRYCYPTRTRVRRSHLTAEQHARAPGGGGASPRRDVLQQIVAKHIHIKNIRQGSPGELRNHLIDKAASTDAADASFGTAGVTNGGVETKMNSQLLTPVDFSWILDIRYISAGFSYKDGGRPGTSTLGNLASDMAHAVC